MGQGSFGSVWNWKVTEFLLFYYYYLLTGIIVPNWILSKIGNNKLPSIVTDLAHKAMANIFESSNDKNIYQNNQHSKTNINRFEVCLSKPFTKFPAFVIRLTGCYYLSPLSY